MNKIHKSRHRAAWDFFAFVAVLVSLVFMGESCPLRAEAWQPIVPTSKDEMYWMVKDIFLTAGSAYTRKDSFDHNMNEVINLFFLPKDERTRYVAESRWFDPSGQEYRTIRKTYDLQLERIQGEERSKKGTTRIHTINTEELANHKQGVWKVSLYLDDKHVRTLTFTVR